MTSSTPACLPMASAVRGLSPVSITTRMPIFWSSLTAWGLSSLMTSATAITPSSIPSRLKNMGVFPWADSASALAWVSRDTAARVLMKP